MNFHNCNSLNRVQFIRKFSIIQALSQNPFNRFDLQVNNSEQMCRLSVEMPSRLPLSLISQLLCCSLFLPHLQSQYFIVVGSAFMGSWQTNGIESDSGDCIHCW